MARPIKIGLDYFPVDTSFDEKIESLDLIHKECAITFIVRFWQSAYKTESGEIDLSGLFGELMANKCHISLEKLLSILETSKQLGLLYQCDSGLWTSHGIKKRIASVSKERKEAIERKNRKESKVNKSKGKEWVHYSENNYNSSENNPQASLKKALDDFEAMRARIGKPLDRPSREAIVKHLYELSTDKNIQIKILNRSVMNGWSSLLPLKEKENKRENTTPIYNEMPKYAKPND